MTKLTDDELVLLAECLTSTEAEALKSTIAEVRERRAADLSAADKDALQRLVAELRSDITKLASPTHEEQILALLDKIIGIVDTWTTDSWSIASIELTTSCDACGKPFTFKSTNLADIDRSRWPTKCETCRTRPR